MLLRELFAFTEAKKQKATDDDSMDRYGRPFNHPEHFVFFKGQRGTLEQLNNFKEIVDEKPGSTSLRRKWDGNPQVYWGREVKNGPLILVGHNQWSRGVKAESPKEIVDFIVNQSGTAKSPEDLAKRNQFAQNFANLYPLFDAATPKNFVGFVYADALYGVDPLLNKRLDDGGADYPKGIYTFCPNPRSKTCYHVDAGSELGNRIAQAKVMVVGHGYFPTFGMDDASQEPLDDFEMFNNSPGLIVQGPIYTETAPEVDRSVLDEVDQAIQYSEQYGSTIDNFLDSLPDADKNGIFYPFFNQMSREHATGQRNFADLSGHDFMEWMKKKGVSASKQKHIVNMVQEHPGGLDAIFFLIKEIRDIKDAIDASIKSQPRREIWDTNGEGHVRYPQKHHKFGAVKYVPTTWVPAGN